MDRPNISVCMATYNGGPYIKEQLESILCQIGVNDEVIISDDMSTDNTFDVIESFQDPRIHIYKHTSDHGFAKNFENALNHASGKYIFLSDQDDFWMPDKVQTTLDYLKKYDFVVSDCITIDSNGKVISESRIKDFNIQTGFWRLMIKTRYLGCCMAFNDQVLKAVLPFPGHTYLMEHDLWIATVAEYYFSTALINKALIEYRRHEENASSGGFSKGYSIPIKVIRRIYRLFCVWSMGKRVHTIRKG